MNYEQKYKDALERAKELFEDMNKKEYFASNGDIENIFPELKESDDDKIRKALISILKSDFEKDTTIFGISVEQIIAWLEKQNKTLNVELLTKVLVKHLYTCVNKTNTYVRSEEDHITLTELIAKIKADLNIK